MRNNFFSLGLFVQLASIGVLTFFAWTLSGIGLAAGSGLAMASFVVGTFFSYREILRMNTRLAVNSAEPRRTR
jgi:hypothetical protein